MRNAWLFARTRQHVPLTHFQFPSQGTEWKADANTFIGTDRETGKPNGWKATRADLIFGSNSELRAISEYYACEDSKELFLEEFVAAWARVMDLDRAY
jgi:catalase-peroxidase